MSRRAHSRSETVIYWPWYSDKSPTCSVTPPPGDPTDPHSLLSSTSRCGEGIVVLLSRAPEANPSHLGRKYAILRLISFFFATMLQRSRKTGKAWKIEKLKTPVYCGEGGKTPPFCPTLVPTVVASSLQFLFFLFFLLFPLFPGLSPRS